MNLTLVPANLTKGIRLSCTRRRMNRSEQPKRIDAAGMSSSGRSPSVAITRLRAVERTAPFNALPIPSPVERIRDGSRIQKTVVKLMTRRSFLQVFVFVAMLVTVEVAIWDGPARADNVEYSALDQISLSYEIPITSPNDGASWPSVLLVNSAQLDTDQPGDRTIYAPRGMIYLSLQMSSGPVQHQYGDPAWGSFFSGMTPLPATAFRYVTPSGRTYVATRINPVDQADNPNADTSDGLVDATYYFIVPITNRHGTVVISPCRTVGTEYEGFTGIATGQLNVGGPTRIAVSFPKDLTVSTPTSQESTAPARRPVASGLNGLVLVLAGLLALLVYSRARRRQRAPFISPPAPRHVHEISPMLDVVAAEQKVEPPSPRASPVKTSASTTATTKTSTATAAVNSPSTLRVDVLGPLTITPSLSVASDPVRAIVAYLAMNNERVLTLEEIQNAVWPLTPAGTDITRRSMRNYMVDVRKVVGEDHLPIASGKSGYQLVRVDTDWAEMSRLLARAKRVAKPEGLALRREALALARGLPFTADTTRYFTWTFTTSVLYKIVETTTNLAHGVATDLVLAGDLTGARDALDLGLLVDPASLTLWEDLTDLLLETADQSLLALHWKAADLVLRPEDVVLLRDREHG